VTGSGIRRAAPVPRIALVPLATEVCTDLAIGRPPAEEVRRHLGYPADALPKARIAERIEVVAAEAEGALRPRGVYAVYAVEAQTPRRIQVAGVAIRGDVARFVGTVDRIGVVVATAAAGISELSERYARDGDSLDAWIADAIGSWAAEAAADAVTDRLTAHAGPGEAVTLRYSPGYCGMSMAQQRVLFGLVDAEAVGVALLPSMLMRPLKSVSGIVGFGPVAELNAVAPGTPCDTCGRLDCHMRR
jgi:hypothetical protein